VARLESVTAIVVAYDSAHVLPACIDALKREGVGVIVVDNASGDGSADVAAAHGARVIRNGANEGYGRGNNIGIAAAETPYVLIVNPDLLMGEGAVAELLAAGERYPGGVMFAPRISEPGGRVFFQSWSLLSPAHLNHGRKGLGVPEGDACAPFLSGACMLLRRDAFLAVGGFDPEIFLFYEDDDLCRRLAAKGSLIHVHDASAMHQRGGSTAPARGRRFTARWHLAWSHAYMSAKYGLPSPVWRGFLINALQAAGYKLVFRSGKVERHWGSAMGYLAWLRGKRALAQQGLD
jgi:N-acetylglucosaminyl-diphospho-decaprenol L-rhamnosyltransferase